MIASDDVILVTGATGFIGKEVVSRLLARGWRVRAMARNIASASPGANERLTVVRADMRDAESLIRAVRGTSAVVHLAAAKSDENDSDDVNVEGARRLVAACKAAGCARLINISTQSVKIHRKGTYARTKSEADRIFRDSRLDVTTLLPSVVYGAAGSGVFDAILKFVRTLPLVPVLGDGKWICAPIHVSDVSSAIVACLESDGTTGKDYDLGGPDLLSFDDLIDRIGAAVGIRRRKVHIPFGLALLAARLLSIFPKPPATISNVLGSNQDTGIDISSARRDFRFAPMNLSAGLALMFAPSPPPGRAGIGHAIEAQQDQALAVDCQLITRYLLGCDPSPDLVVRYCEAWHHFNAAGQIVPDSEWHWTRRHPWALPFVDAAAAVLRPESAVRKQIFVMAALLEATTTHADFFLRQPAGRVGAVAAVMWQGLRCSAKLAIGIPLFLWSRRS